MPPSLRGRRHNYYYCYYSTTTTTATATAVANSTVVVMCVFNVSSGLGNSMPSNDVIERLSSDQPSSSSSTNDQQSWSHHTQPPLASYLPARHSENTPHREDQLGSWTYWCQPDSQDNQSHHRWSEQRLVWSPTLRGSDSLSPLHRPKPLRYRPYRGIPTTNSTVAMHEYWRPV